MKGITERKAMSNLVKKVVLMAVVAVAGLAFAHNGEDHGAGAQKHVKGTVESFADSKLVLKGTDGKPVNVHVDAKAVIETNGAPGKLEDLKPGARVVAMGEPMKDGTLHATKLRIAGAEKKVAGRKVRPQP